jgi:hypothetical protein
MVVASVAGFRICKAISGSAKLGSGISRNQSLSRFGRWSIMDTSVKTG